MIRGANGIAKPLCAIIMFLNPGTIVLTGDLINEETLQGIKGICVVDIPSEYMPQFRGVDNFNEYYYEGMYQLAADRKEL